MDKYQQAIEEAKQFHAQHSRDKAHDLTHHEAVWKNCQWLLKVEKPYVNINLLKVATFWHDVIISEVKWPSKLNVHEVCEYLAVLLPKLDFSVEETSKVILTVKHHEFRDTPKTVEGMVLQDADKIEAVSIARWNRTFADYQQGRMTKESLAAYLATFLKWAPILTATFYYASSRQRVAKNLQLVWHQPQWEQTFDDFGLVAEYQVANKTRNSFKTVLLRCFLRIKAEFIKFFL